MKYYTVENPLIMNHNTVGPIKLIVINYYRRFQLELWLAFLCFPVEEVWKILVIPAI